MGKPEAFDPIRLLPVAYVKSPIRDTVDDVWGDVVSEVQLDASRFSPESLIGLDQFSHVELTFLFDRVSETDVTAGARHPRGRQDWPRVGIFAQRAKNRPNRPGVTICRLRSVQNLSIFVEGLDAIDGTPVLDIKPYMRELAPRGEIHQPPWSSELMSRYWDKAT